MGEQIGTVLGAEEIEQNVYYRCTARSLAPGAAALADHPQTVNLREDVITGAINECIGGLFSRENRDETVRALMASQDGSAAPTVRDREDVRGRLKSAEEALRRLQDAILAGVDPAAVRDAINAAQAQREAARAELNAIPDMTVMTDAEVYAMIDALGDVGGAIEGARPESLMKLYRDLGIAVSCDHAESGGLATVSLVVASVRVRGGT